MTTNYPDLSIDEYLRERLMPVEGSEISSRKDRGRGPTSASDWPLPQKSIGVVTSFVFSSCDFVDRSLSRTDDPRVTRKNTNQKYFRIERDVTFEARAVLAGRMDNGGLCRLVFR